MPDALTDRARMAAKEIRKKHCQSFKTYSREEHKRLTEDRECEIAAIITRNLAGLTSGMESQIAEKDKRIAELEAALTAAYAKVDELRSILGPVL